MRLTLRLQWITGLVLLSCGGSTFDSGGGADASADGASGGSSNSGGASSTGGGSSTGGAPNGSGGNAGTGGTSGTGGTTGGGGSGTGGTPGAGGSGNDGGIDWSACAGPGECAPELTGCCGTCGMPEVSSYAGVNPKYHEAFRAATCADPIPNCPKCATIINPNIGARCEDQHCAAFDVRKVPEYSKCATDGDCQLRNGVTCCECGGNGWVALNASGARAIATAVCGPNMACDECAPMAPAGTVAACVEGHCEVACHCAPNDVECQSRCSVGTSAGTP